MSFSKVFVLSVNVIVKPHSHIYKYATSPFLANSLSVNAFTKKQCNTSISCMSTVMGNPESSLPIPKSVSVQVAHELLQTGHRYLDVRTTEEFNAGHAVGAINVPLLFRAPSGMTKNPKFLEGVSSHFSKEDEIVVGCQMGRRSLMAATDLIHDGYTGVTDVAGGYAAWTQNGLPIEK